MTKQEAFKKVLTSINACNVDHDPEGTEELAEAIKVLDQLVHGVRF